MQWFRFYAEALNDPKVQTLDGDTFKFWVNCLCVACNNNGTLPETLQLAFLLRIHPEASAKALDSLIKASLVDVLKNQHGQSYYVHGWDKRQYKSDTSTDRVKRFRNATKTVTETPPDTDTDTDTEQKKKNTPIIPLQPLDVSPEVWADFVALRKKKKAVITETVVKGIRREAEAAGWTMEAALTETVTRNWQSFKAEWVNKENNYGNKHQNSTTSTSDKTRIAAAQALQELRAESFMDSGDLQLPLREGSGEARRISGGKPFDPDGNV